MKAPTVEDTVRFCRALRERGLAVTPSEAVDAVRTLGLIDIADRDEVFSGLRAVLTSRVEDFPIFDELFDGFWDLMGRNTQPRSRGPLSPLDSQEQHTRISTRQHAGRGLAFFLEQGAGAKASNVEPVKVPGTSDFESAALKDFSLFTAAELKEIERLARRIARKLAANPSRRWKPVRRGPRVNLRRMLRQSLKTGGELVEVSFKQRKQKKTRLVVICDVSGSMDIYSRLLLQFVYGLQNSFARVETFVFSTSLERVTGHLKGKVYSRALDRLSANVRGWSGGTLIGQSVAAFNAGWSMLVDKRTIVIILSDGWDTGEPEQLAASLATLKRRAGRLIWLNPLLGNRHYQPLTRGMQAALPYIDVFAPAHDLPSLRALEPNLIL